MRKAFNIKQKQLKTNLDSRILLIGGTNSKYLNYSDQNKQEVAHFFYPCLYLKCMETMTASNIANQSKIDIKPDHGFVQRIELHQQFSPQQIASMNHNYIVKTTTIEKIMLDVVDNKKQTDPQKYYLEQLHVEIRILESQILNQKKDLYIKTKVINPIYDNYQIIQIQINKKLLVNTNQFTILCEKKDNVADEHRDSFQFNQTFIGIDLPTTGGNDGNKMSMGQSTQSTQSQQSTQKEMVESKQNEQQYIEMLQNQHPIYANKEDTIDGIAMVQTASKLNMITINDFAQKRAEHIQVLSDKIYLDKNQRFQGCFFTSFSMLLEVINCKMNNTYQINKVKLKAKASFWENMKHYSKKQLQQQQQMQPGLQPQETELPTTVSLPYESTYSQIIFNQQHIKCLMPNGNTDLSKYALNCKTAHQNETDEALHIYQKEGSSKLLVYDDEIHQFVQIQMLVYHSGKGQKIIPEAGQISKVFYNYKDQHIYIYVEEEWKFNYKNIIMRAPISQINYQTQSILFFDEICKQSVNLNKLTFTINSNDKLFGILQEKYLPPNDAQLDSQNNDNFISGLQQNKWILIQQKYVNKSITCDHIIKLFETIQKADDKLSINIIETQCYFGCIDVDPYLMKIPFYLAILGKQVQLEKLKNSSGGYIRRPVEVYNILMQILKEQKENANDSDLSKFRCLSIQTKKSIKNEGLIETAINLLCEPNVRSLIHQSFHAIILEDIISDGNVFSKLGAEKDYKITYFDISGLRPTNDKVYDGLINFFEQKGSLLKYLNISTHRNLLIRLITNSKYQYFNSQKDKIKFDQLIYLDISQTSLISKYVFIDYLQYLLNTCSHLKGININKLWEEGSSELLLTFDDLKRSNFSSLCSYDYDLQVYIEKSQSNNLQDNEDQLIDKLKTLCGDNIVNVVGMRDYQKLKIKSKNATQETSYSERVDKLFENIDVFKDPIVFSTDTKYLIFERLNFLKKDKEKYTMRFHSILQSESQKSELQKIKDEEIVTISFKEEVFQRFDIMNISKMLNDEGEKFTLFGIMHDQNYRAYTCKINLPVPTGQDIQYDQVQIYQGKTNIKKYSRIWRNDCYLPISHNKKVKNTYLCVKDTYQYEGYSFFKAEELLNSR